jgi:hypothetical protein
MTTASATAGDRRTILSTLWIFALFNYLYADFVTLMVSPGTTQMAGQMSEVAVLGLAVLMETAILMVVLSRVLPHSANRWSNIAAGVLHTVFVAATMARGVPPLYYVFFAAIEIACTVFIVWYAWSWRQAPQTAFAA